MGALALHAIVAISGAVVLAVEILGTRILGPYYGVSLYLWSALIAVTLLSLAAGYAAGGRLADRRPQPATLATILAIAGLWLVLIPWIRTPFLRLATPLGLRAAVLVAAVVLFAPPLTLLGMVSPFAIRLRASTLAGIGRVAGDLFAISTTASVASALAVGFWLIPSFGVTALMRMCGALLFLAAGIALAADPARRGPGRALAPALLLVATALSAALAVSARHPSTGAGTRGGGAERDGGAAAPVVLATRESAYGEIRILEHDGKRLLLIDGGIHTVTAPGSWETYFAYVPVLDIPRFFHDRPGRLLLVGLGGGSVAKNYAAAGWKVDAVEIDPEVSRVAREFFGLAPGDAVVHDTDGRAFLESHPGPWDVIAVDAFGSSSIPFHLASVEVFRLMASRLTPGGILAMNVEAVGWKDPLVAAIARTLGEVLPNVSVLPVIEPPDRVGNLVFLAARRPLEFDEDRLGRPYHLLREPYRHWCSVQMNHAWNNRFLPHVAQAARLTDDRNPVDVMTERVNLAARMNLHENADLRSMAWE